jgi:hypothetical protein
VIPIPSPFDNWNSSLQSRIDFIKRIQTTNCASASDSIRFWNTLNVDQRNWIVNSTNLINSYTSQNSAALQWDNLNKLNSGLQSAIQNLNKTDISDSTLKAFTKQISLATCLSRSAIQAEIIRQLQAPLNALFNTSDTSDRKSELFKGIFLVNTLESYLVDMSQTSWNIQFQFSSSNGQVQVQGSSGSQMQSQSSSNGGQYQYQSSNSNGQMQMQG